MLQQPHSKTSPHNAFNAISLTLACSVLMFSGCQAMKTKFSSLPTAGNLAFWKKESESLQPPPPARHLDPSPTDGVGGLKSALAKVSGEGEADDYRRKIDEIKQGIASTQKKMDESLSSAEPLRSPYSGDDSGLAEATNSFKSDFKAAGNSIDQGFARAKEQGSGTRTLNDAETKFKSAVADVKQASGGGFKTPSDILSTKPANDFKAALASATADLKSSANESVKKPLEHPMSLKWQQTLSTRLASDSTVRWGQLVIEQPKQLNQRNRLVET